MFTVDVFLEFLLATILLVIVILWVTKIKKERVGGTAWLYFTFGFIALLCGVLLDISHYLLGLNKSIIFNDIVSQVFLGKVF